MAFHFSANQFENAYRPTGLKNWELPRFSPPRPRLLSPKKATFVVDKNGHLLPDARRDGNSFGQFRGTWQLPNCITRRFVKNYDACLTGRYKFRSFPRDLCSCDFDKNRKCDRLRVLGKADDPNWQKPKCQTKCQGWAKVRNWNTPAAVNKGCPDRKVPADKLEKLSVKKKRSRSKQKKTKAQALVDGMTVRQHQLQQFQQQASAKVQRYKQRLKDLEKRALKRQERLAAKKAAELAAKPPPGPKRGLAEPRNRVEKRVVAKPNPTCVSKYNDDDVSVTKYNPPDLEYVPGDFTEPEQRLPSRQLLLDQKYKENRGIEQELPLNRLYLGEHECHPPLDDYTIAKRAVGEVSSAARREFPALTAAVNAYRTGDNLADEVTDTFKPGRDLVLPITPPTANYNINRNPNDLQRNMPMRSITEKPNERCPSPVVPAYANFELAKRMHQDNLDHQPLPDCVADLAFRKAQINGPHPGLSLDISPIATGVGVKTYNAGPTHCTKVKVFRPPSNTATFRGVASAPTKKMGAMDLAICWDYKPSNPFDEPKPAKHIDGSNDSAGPAVFTCVKTPGRDEQPQMDLGRSAGVFNSTLGETDFFDKDILKRKTDFGGRKIEADADCRCDYTPPEPRAHSMSRESSATHYRRPFGSDIGDMPTRLAKQYQSNPMLSNKDKEYKALRAKYLGPDPGEGLGRAIDFTHPEPACKRNTFFRRPSRARSCHKVAPAPEVAGCCPPSFNHCLPSKSAFRAGVPRLNAAGDFVSSDSACSLGSNRVLVVPRPRNPYSKKNYDIDTLVPPFRSMAGGANQGGYPEHWRLASVYQHAYKPVEQRRRTLLQTVYK